MTPKENQKSASDFDALEPRKRGCSPLLTPKQRATPEKTEDLLTVFSGSADLKPLSRCATAPLRGSTPSQALPRQLSRRESQAVNLVAKVLGVERKLPAVLLPLPLGEVDLRSKDGEGEDARPQRCAFAESGAANTVFLHDPTRENAMPERPQTLRHCSIKNNFSADDAQSERGAHSKSSRLTAANQLNRKSFTAAGS